MQEGFVNYNQQSFDPNTLANQTSTVIMFCVISDKSPSVDSYAHIMNTAAKEIFIDELKNCHRKNDIVVKNITFNENVDHTSGFMPILNVKDDYFDIVPSGRSTALYQAVFEGLQQTLEYRKNLEEQGIEVRVNIFIDTDGQDNASPNGTADKIKAIVDDLRRNEALASSFTIIMLGVGEERYFKQSCIDMGLDPSKCLVTASQSAKEIRKHMGVVSQSVSSSGGGNGPVNF